MKPVFAYFKEDSLTFLTMKSDDVNGVLGMNLIFKSTSPQSAQNMVAFMGRYLKRSLLFFRLSDYITDSLNQTEKALYQYEIRRPDTDFSLRQNANKLKEIKALLEQYPEAKRAVNNQLVSVQEGGDRFLPLVTQMVVIESILADLRKELVALKRLYEINSLMVEFFRIVQPELSLCEMNGELLLVAIKKAKDTLFLQKNMDDEVVKYVYSSLGISLLNFELGFS